MKEIVVVCTRCGHRFKVKVFEPGEAEHERRPSHPVHCEKCGGSVRRLE